MRNDGQPNEWVGFDFATARSGMNPLAASYVGAPHMVRGIDPARNALDALEWFGQGAPAPEEAVTPSADAATGIPIPGVDGITKWLDEKGRAIAIGGTGVFIGLVLVVVGVLILFFARD